jgi:putative FmdB family regulatory protein
VSVPTYEYQCDQCRRTFEVRQRITADPLTRCEACGGPLRRLLSPAPFILKGEGWYVTDYPSESRKKARESEKAGAGGPATSSEKSSTGTTTETESKAAPSPNPSADAPSGTASY